MQNIVRIVSEKTGLSESQSQLAVNAVVSYLKDKLPGGVGHQLESFVNGGNAGANIGNILSNNAQNPANQPTNSTPGNMQNQAQNPNNQNISQKDKADDAIDNIKDKLGGIFGK